MKKKKDLSIFNLRFFLPILVALLVIAAAAFCLNWVERAILARQQAFSGSVFPARAFQEAQQVSEIINEGYLEKNQTASPSREREVGLLDKEEEEPKVLAATFENIKVDTSVWQAEKVNQSFGQVNLEPGQAITFWVDFKNTGSATWYKDSDHFVALNVTDPAGRVSPFKHHFWTEYYYRPCRMLNEKVEPGETARFRFALKAPQEPGYYLEKFHLVAENLLWIPGGALEIPIKVGNPLPYWQAKKVDQSFGKVTLEPGQAITFWVDFQNVGSATWRNDSDHFIALNVTDPAGRKSPFEHEFWQEYYYRPCRMSNQEIKTGEIARFRFALQAPAEPGNYLEKYHLVAENLIWIPGGYLEIPIRVEAPYQGGPPATLDGEADVRVGLYATEEPIKITADKGYQIKNSAGQLLASPQKEVVATVNFDFKQKNYQLKVGSILWQGKNYLRFLPQETNTIFEITNLENRSGWKPEYNDNKFRGILEVRYAEKTDKLWLINELSLESYLRGVSEGANDDPLEFLKALIVAERTYAQYHINTDLKHAEENFHVDSVNDQIYRGYGFESRAPNIVELIEETAGLMVTYENEIVVTPYFSQTDGRTRAWEEVWSGGAKPWLVSVPDPACQGLELLGHGVGLSARGARSLAQEGKTYQEILKYYYTDIVLKDFY